MQELRVRKCQVFKRNIKLALKSQQFKNYSNKQINKQPTNPHVLSFGASRWPQRSKVAPTSHHSEKGLASALRNPVNQDWLWGRTGFTLLFIPLPSAPSTSAKEKGLLHDKVVPISWKKRKTDRMGEKNPIGILESPIASNHPERLDF